MTENDTSSTNTPEEPQPAAAEAPQSVETAAAAATTESDEKRIAHETKEVKDEEGSIKRYVVEVDRSVYNEKIQDIFGDLRKTVIIDGFRRGKAPVSLLRNRFGKEAQQDAVNDLAANVAEQLIENNKLDVIGEPGLHESHVDDESKPVTLEIDIEVQPELDVTDYRDETFQVEVEPVTDEMVDAQIEQLRRNNTTYEDIEDAEKPYEKGDTVVVDIEVVDDNGSRMESLCREEFLVRDPERNLMPEVAEEMIGKKPGETFTKTVERTVKNRRGKDVTHKDTYTVTVKKIQKAVVPELTDQFAKDLGGDFETVEDLRKEVRQGLEQSAERSKRERLMEKVFDHLVEKNPFDAPRTLVASQEYQTLLRDSRQMSMMGLDLGSIGMTTEDYMHNARENAARVVKMHLLISSIAKKESIEVTDDDVQKEIERMAEEQGRRPLAVRARLEREKRIDQLKQSLQVSKVEDFLIENNKVEEVEAKPEAETPEEAETAEQPETTE